MDAPIGPRAEHTLTTILNHKSENIKPIIFER